MPDAASGPGRSTTALLGAFSQVIAPRFARAEPRRRAYDYLTGLLAAPSRCNSRRLADLAGETRVDGMQRLLTSAKWDQDAVCGDLRGFVAERLHDRGGGILTLVEEAFARKGAQSAGVARQYRWSGARVENCQIGLFLVFTPPGGAGLMLDRELYLPPSWAVSRERRTRARVPDGVGYRTPGQLAARMIERTLAAPLPVRWVVADLPHAADPHLRAVLDARRTPYLLGVEGRESVAPGGGRTTAPIVPSAVAGGVLRGGRFHQTGSGRSRYAWSRVPLGVRRDAPLAHWLLVRRALSGRADTRYYLCRVPHGTDIHEMTAAVDPRPVEDGLRLAHEWAALNRYEVQTWQGWYRHVTLAIAAQACLALGRDGVGECAGRSPAGLDAQQ